MTVRVDLRHPRRVLTAEPQVARERPVRRLAVLGVAGDLGKPGEQDECVPLAQTRVPGRLHGPELEAVRMEPGVAHLDLAVEEPASLKRGPLEVRRVAGDAVCVEVLDPVDRLPGHVVVCAAVVHEHPHAVLIVQERVEKRDRHGPVERELAGRRVVHREFACDELSALDFGSRGRGLAGRSGSRLRRHGRLGPSGGGLLGGLGRADVGERGSRPTPAPGSRRPQEPAMRSTRSTRASDTLPTQAVLGTSSRSSDFAVATHTSSAKLAERRAHTRKGPPSGRPFSWRKPAGGGEGAGRSPLPMKICCSTRERSRPEWPARPGEALPSRRCGSRRAA